MGAEQHHIVPWSEIGVSVRDNYGFEAALGRIFVALYAHIETEPRRHRRSRQPAPDWRVKPERSSFSMLLSTRP